MPHAVVLLSGGLDSATALAIAQHQGFTCHGLAANYGQRHNPELKAATVIAEATGISLKTLAIDLAPIANSALTDRQATVPTDMPAGIPATYVPARNTVLLSLALAYAESLSARDIFIGVNSQDYSGYPDCRLAYIAAFERMARLATKIGVEGATIRVHNPLQFMRKGEIIRLGLTLGVDYGRTRSCYDLDSQGRACGKCDSCRLRAQGFQEAGVADPTPYRT